MSEIIADVLMVEDDDGRRRIFCEYAETRGDIKAHVTSYASDIWAMITNSLEKKSPIDLVLLDIRLPELPVDRRNIPPNLRDPRGARLAKELRENPNTSSTPVVIYTEYAAAPVVANELNYLRQNCSNVVAIHLQRPSVDEILHSGLIRTNHLGLTIQQDNVNRERIAVSVGTQFTHKDLKRSKFLLNGSLPQTINSTSSDLGLLLTFDAAIFYPNDYNYLMVQSKDKRKAFFSVR